jgi:uncharacterized membrane protein YgdD (TMEM256/DUF423 family)
MGREVIECIDETYVCISERLHIMRKGMVRMLKLFVALGSLNMFLSVALGAFGAHGLKNKLSSDMLNVYETGVRYHMIHAIGLIVIGLLAEKLGNPSMLGWSGWLMLAGIVLFAGSLYALSISGVKILGAITPIGGVCFLAAWILLAIAALRA